MYIAELTNDLEWYFKNLDYILKRKEKYIVLDLLNRGIKEDITDINEFRIFINEYNKKKIYRKIKKPEKTVIKREVFNYE